MALTSTQLEEAKQLAGTVSQGSFSPTNDPTTFSKYQDYRTQIQNQIQSNPLLAGAGNDVGGRLADIYLGIDKGGTWTGAVGGFGGPEDIQSKYGGLSGLANYLVSGGQVQQVSNPETTTPSGGKNAAYTSLNPVTTPGVTAPTGLSTTQPGGFDITQPGGGFVPPNRVSSKFQQGFEQANKALGDQEVSGTQGASLVNQYSPGRKNDFSSMFVQSDPILGGLVKAFQDFSSPQNQRVSLKETYDQMIKDSGVQAIDTELLDMKKVIEGTEEDLRTEITKAGGFATESQIQALTNARNKQLIKNYNQLIDLRNSKEKYLNTAIGLEQADRQSADQRFESMFNMGVQIANMQQQMQNNARTQMQWLANNMGFDGLYNSTGGDPYYTNLVEQTLGLPQGGLLSAANQVEMVKVQAQREAQLDLQLKQQQLKTPEEIALDTKIRQAQLRKLDADTAKIFNDMADTASGEKKLSATQYMALGYGSRLVQSGNIINKIGDEFAKTPAPNFSLFGINLYPGFLKSDAQKQFEQAKRNFINANLRKESGAAISPEEFESAELQYFPKFGDDAQTLQNKLENRNLATANLLREGGMDNVDPSKLTVSPSGELIELID